MAKLIGNYIFYAIKIRHLMSALVISCLDLIFQVSVTSNNVVLCDTDMDKVEVCAIATRDFKNRLLWLFCYCYLLLKDIKSKSHANVTTNETFLQMIILNDNSIAKDFYFLDTL